MSIKAYDNELQGKEEAGRMSQMNELFTRSTSLKFVNTLDKKLLGHQGLSTF